MVPHSNGQKTIYMDQGKLYLREDGREIECTVRSDETNIYVGCTSITREAFEYVLRRVRNG